MELPLTPTGEWATGSVEVIHILHPFDTPQPAGSGRQIDVKSRSNAGHDVADLEMPNI